MTEVGSSGKPGNSYSNSQAGDPNGDFKLSGIRDTRPTIGDGGSVASMRAQLLGNQVGRPDTCLDGGYVEDLLVRAASVRGHSHRFSSYGHVSRSREDEYALRTSHDGRWLVAVVADGVSGSDRGALAATTAARVGANSIVSHLDEGGTPDDVPWTSIIERVSGIIIREVRKLLGRDEFQGQTVSDDELREMSEVASTTAIGLIIRTKADSDELPYFAANLAGDSSVWLLADGRWHVIIGGKDSGAEVTSNAVNPLPLVAANPQPRLASGRISQGQAVIVMSDGLGDPLHDGSGPVGDFLADAWQSPPDLHEFGRQLDFYSRSFTDDRTAVAIWLSANRT